MSFSESPPQITLLSTKFMHEGGGVLQLDKYRVNCPCPKQGRNPSATFAPILPTEPEDHDQTIHRVTVNGLIVISRFYG